MTDTKTLAVGNEILRGLVGSTAHGTAIDGQDDRDEMGVCIEPPEYVCGLSLFEQYIFRTQPEGVRSGPGDLDLTIYSLRKFCHLAAKGNPSILALLWLPSYITQTDLGKWLVELRPAFVSRESGWRYYGYLTSQRMGLTGEKTKKVARPELVEKYGYDTKYAMHAMRLGLQGIEYLTHGRISIPVAEPDLSYLRKVRSGQLSLETVLADIAGVEIRLKALAEATTKQADYAAINNFLVEAHSIHWTRA
jgi:predicted nucleotidyltransferase